VLVGGYAAPLYYLSDGQLNVEIPAELTPNQSYAVVVSTNAGIAVPDTINLIAATPGVAALPNGQLIAQHSADFSLVDAAHPAKPGEILIAYLVGMGSTLPAVASGQSSPTREPLARVTTPATLTIDGQTANILYAGLTPGAAGLYQINFQVPATARTGNLSLVVSQDGQPANAATLPVAK
jgi:uncharacterized protein (TIGR03437 family)